MNVSSCLFLLQLRWENFTDAVVKVLSTRKNIVYLLWGNPAQLKYAFATFYFILLFFCCCLHRMCGIGPLQLDSSVPVCITTQSI